MTHAYIYDAIRTPRGKGKATGALFQTKPIQLLSILLEAIQERNPSLDPTRVDDLITGCVTPVEEQGANIAKTALLYAGWPNQVPGIQINRFCASGLEAVNMAATRIRAGWAEMMLAGGIESMSRVPMESDGGALLHDPEVLQKVAYIPQGISADLIATLDRFTRQRLDEYALQSQQRAAHAQANGYFRQSIIPIQDENGLLILDHEENIRSSTTIEKLHQLNPAFEHIGRDGFDAIALMKYPEIERIEHVHTAGNSSGIVDGAGLILLGTEEAGTAMGLKPRARVVAASTVGAEPTLMLKGPEPATKKALQIAGMKPSDIDLWEMNEAFAAPVLSFQQAFDIPDDILNVNGGAIALGHPLGATGAILLNTLLDELERRDLRTGLVTMCVGGGMGIATIIERV